MRFQQSRSISSKLALLVTLAAVLVSITHASSAPSISNTIYMIRHGEKPSDGGQGLSAQGEERAECLTNVMYLIIL